MSKQKVNLCGGSFLCLCLIVFFLWAMVMQTERTNNILERLADGVYVYVVK